MPKVVMQVSIASADWSYGPTQEVELDDEKAAAWEAAGHCVIISGKEAGGENVMGSMGLGAAGAVAAATGKGSRKARNSSDSGAVDANGSESASEG